MKRNTSKAIFYDKKILEVIFIPRHRKGKFHVLKVTDIKKIKTIFLIYSLVFIVTTFLSPFPFFHVLILIFFFFLLVHLDEVGLKSIGEGIPGLAYRKMSEFQIEEFLKRKFDNDKNLKIIEIPSLNIHHYKSIPKKEEKTVDYYEYNKKAEKNLENRIPKSQIQQSKKGHNNKTKDIEIDNNSVSSKSIFDNYESVLDNFDKK